MPARQPDAVDEQIGVLRRVRALETRAMPWYRDLAHGAAYTSWERALAPSPHTGGFYWKIQGDRVALTGNVTTSGTGATLGTLPERARPLQDQELHVMRHSGFVLFTGLVLTDGRIQVSGIPSGSFLSIGDLSYPTAELE